MQEMPKTSLNMNFLTTQQTADALGLDRRTILKYIQRGLIEASKFGRDWQIDSTEIERYQAERRKPGRPRNNSARPSQD